MGFGVSDVNLPGHKQMEDFIARCFWQCGEKVGFWAVDSRLLLNVILQHHGIGQLWKAESSA